MSYSRHNWECGEVVTNEKLNNIEDGVQEALACCGGEDYIVTFTLTQNDPPVYSCDRTTNEIVAAFQSGKRIVPRKGTEGYWQLGMLFLENVSTPSFGFLFVDCYDNCILAEKIFVTIVNGADSVMCSITNTCAQS